MKKEKEFVIGRKITEGEYEGMMLHNNPRDLPEATEEDLKNQNIYTITEQQYNNNKKMLIWNYDNAVHRYMKQNKSLYNAYDSMYGLTRLVVQDTIERCEDFIKYIQQYNRDLSIYAEAVKKSLEKALKELDKTTKQQNKIKHFFDEVIL